MTAAVHIIEVIDTGALDDFQEVNTPTDLMEIENCLGFGNVVVFDLDKETEVGTVMCW